MNLSVWSFAALIRGEPNWRYSIVDPHTEPGERKPPWPRVPPQTAGARLFLVTHFSCAEPLARSREVRALLRPQSSASASAAPA